MSVLSNTQIEAAIAEGHVVCHPLIPENIRGSSIDMTLGEWYYLCDGGLGRTYNPFSEDDVKRYFKGPKRAEPYDGNPDCNGRREIEFDGIPDDHPLILMPPHSRILAHTHEFIGIHPPGTTEMRARSSWGRNGIAVCLCAGWGDPGYINRWTMEIHNMNDVYVPLPVGERVAQLVFHETSPVDGHYGDGNSKYQAFEDVKMLVELWTPEDMLPRSYKDDRRLPIKP